MNTLASIGEGTIGTFAVGDYQILDAGSAGGSTSLSGAGTVVGVGESSVRGETAVTAVAVETLVVEGSVGGTTTIEGAVTLPRPVRTDEGVTRGERTGVPEDTAYPFAFDSTGDIETVSGSQFYEQHALLLGAGVLDTQLGRSLTANDITEIESTVQQAYANSPYFDRPIRVQVTEVDGDEITIQASFGADDNVRVPISQRDVETIQR